jgi:hypothetical protein
MASAHEAGPYQVGGLLKSSEQHVPAAHVLVEAQLAARPQDPVKLGERRLRRYGSGSTATTSCTEPG